MEVGVVVLPAVSLVVARPVPADDAVTSFAREGNGPVATGSLFPFVVTTTACGALSGPPALIAAPVLDRGPHHAVDSPAGATGGTVDPAPRFVRGRRASWHQVAVVVEASSTLTAVDAGTRAARCCR